MTGATPIPALYTFMRGQGKTPFFYVHTKTCQVNFISVRICPKHTHTDFFLQKMAHRPITYRYAKNALQQREPGSHKTGKCLIGCDYQFLNNDSAPWNWLVSVSQEWLRSMESVGIGFVTTTAPWNWLVTALKLWSVKCEDECAQWTFRNSYKYL